MEEFISGKRCKGMKNTAVDHFVEISGHGKNFLYTYIPAWS
jgi:uncharacterized protein YpbB